MRFAGAALSFLTAALFALSSLTAAPVSGYRIVGKLPHSTANYTEGLFYLDGLFFEGTGLRGQSAIIVSDPETGKILQKRALPEQYFGEGIVNWGPNILEWTNLLCL